MNEVAEQLYVIAELYEEGLLNGRQKAILKSHALRRDPRLTDILSRAEVEHDGIEETAQHLRNLALAEQESLYEEVFSFLDADDGKEASRRERSARSLMHDATLVYGEIAWRSFAEVLAFIGPRPGSRFLDLGAGVGRPCVAAALLADFAKVTGVELLDSLSHMCVRAGDNLARVVAERGVFTRSEVPEMEVVKGSFLEYDWGDVDVVFANSTCFDDAMMEGIAHRAAQLAPGAFIITFTRRAVHPRLVPVFARRMKQSWGAATVHVAVVVSQEQADARVRERERARAGRAEDWSGDTTLEDIDVEGDDDEDTAQQQNGASLPNGAQEPNANAGGAPSRTARLAVPPAQLPANELLALRLANGPGRLNGKLGPAYQSAVELACTQYVDIWASDDDDDSAASSASPQPHAAQSASGRNSAPASGTSHAVGLLQHTSKPMSDQGSVASSTSSSAFRRLGPRAAGQAASPPVVASRSPAGDVLSARSELESPRSHAGADVSSLAPSAHGSFSTSKPMLTAVSVPLSSVGADDNRESPKTVHATDVESSAADAGLSSPVGEALLKKKSHRDVATDELDVAASSASVSASQTPSAAVIPRSRLHETLAARVAAQEASRDTSSPQGAALMHAKAARHDAAARAVDFGGLDATSISSPQGAALMNAKASRHGNRAPPTLPSPSTFGDAPPDSVSLPDSQRAASAFPQGMESDRTTTSGDTSFLDLGAPAAPASQPMFRPVAEPHAAPEPDVTAQDIAVQSTESPLQPSPRRKVSSTSSTGPQQPQAPVQPNPSAVAASGLGLHVAASSGPMPAPTTVLWASPSSTTQESATLSPRRDLAPSTAMPSAPHLEAVSSHTTPITGDRDLVLDESHDRSLSVITDADDAPPSPGGRDRPPSAAAIVSVHPAAEGLLRSLSQPGSAQAPITSTDKVVASPRGEPPQTVIEPAQAETDAQNASVDDLSASNTERLRLRQGSLYDEMMEPDGDDGSDDDAPPSGLGDEARSKDTAVAARRFDATPHVPNGGHIMEQLLRDQLEAEHSESPMGDMLLRRKALARDKPDDAFVDDEPEPSPSPARAAAVQDFPPLSSLAHASAQRDRAAPSPATAPSDRLPMSYAAAARAHMRTPPHAAAKRSSPLVPKQQPAGVHASRGHAPVDRREAAAVLAQVLGSTGSDAATRSRADGSAPATASWTAGGVVRALEPHASSHPPSPGRK